MATPAIYLKEILEKTTSSGQSWMLLLISYVYFFTFSVYADQQKALHYIEEATRINLVTFVEFIIAVLLLYCSAL